MTPPATAVPTVADAAGLDALGPLDPALPAVPTVAIAGATGYVGTALRAALAGRFRVVGLTRSPTRAAAPDTDGTEWRHCDLFSLLQFERSLADVDLLVYLVHSMLPSARMTQGSFEDLDLLLADNAARAAATAGVRQVVYLGGLLPPGTGDGSGLSPHLRSRLEVERALGAGAARLTALRAGLVVGPGGSSLKILVGLVRRLPGFVLPRWTQSRTQPVALADAVRAVEAVLGRPAAYGQTLDVGGPDVMTYAEMLRRTAAVMGLRRPAVRVPLVSPGLSKLWVSVVSGSPRALAEPLVESLRHDMVARPNALLAALQPGAVGFEAALRTALATADPLVDPQQALRPGDDRVLRTHSRVRSVQRMALPPGRDAAWAAQEYLRWLPRVGRPLLRVETEGVREGAAPQRASFFVRPLPTPILVLEHSAERSTAGRAVFYVVGGLLANAEGSASGRLEFRSVLPAGAGGATLLAAIHDFSPRLPWGLYRATQATAHLGVMRGFARHLRRLTRGDAATA